MPRKPGGLKVKTNSVAGNSVDMSRTLTEMRNQCSGERLWLELETWPLAAWSLKCRWLNSQQGGECSEKAQRRKQMILYLSEERKSSQVVKKQNSSAFQSWGKHFRKEGAVSLGSCCNKLRQSQAEKRALDLVTGLSPVTFAHQRQGRTENCPTKNSVNQGLLSLGKEGEMKS